MASGLREFLPSIQLMRVARFVHRLPSHEPLSPVHVNSRLENLACLVLNVSPSGRFGIGSGPA
jgi:hypothetical protein